MMVKEMQSDTPRRGLLSRLSLRTKLTGTIVATSTLSLLLASTVFLMMQNQIISDAMTAEQASAFLGRLGQIGLASFVISFTVAYLVARAFEQAMVKPVDDVIDVIERIRRERDYSARVEQFSDDEFGRLISSFNMMLDELQARDVQIAQTLRALETARDQAETANVSKSQFLANMSHELRTPLNAIIGYTEILIEDLEDEGAAGPVDDLGKIRRSAHHLLTLINDILDLSKIEAGRMLPDAHLFDVSSLMDEVLATIKPIAAQKKNQLIAHIDPGIGDARSDSVKIRQCLLNLMSNACKFSEEGIVTLSVRVLEHTDADGLLQFTVSDTGIGMSAEQLDNLFQPFMQADASTTRKFGGTGLGLAITKRFAELLGGDITVTSEPGVGTTFTMVLPRNVPNSQSNSEEFLRAVVPMLPAAETHISRSVNDTQTTNPDAPLILVVEDEPSSRELMTRWLSRMGYRVETAADGEQGLEKARRCKPAVILLDVTMPKMTGFEVLKQLQSDPVTEMIPTIMVTAHDDRRYGLLMGAAEHLTKPIERQDLARILTLYSGKGEGEVLLVEDDPSIAEIYTRGIAQAGFAVHHARNGVEALGMMDFNTYSLAIVDLMMPEMDGFELIEKLEQRDPNKTMPIMVVTAKELTREDRARLAGRINKLHMKGGLSPRELVKDIFTLTEVTEIPVKRAVNG
jgi:signal transduction histidine kinase/DNA-binding response OmpR family regulator